MDVSTRMVTGFHLSMDAPSRLSISFCLLHAVYDKAAWLQERGIDAAWPIAGLPGALRADNGTDFRSRAFVRACRDAGIKTIWRKPGTPHYSGHIERLIGTQMGAVHLLPETTFSDLEERADFDSTREARLNHARPRTLRRLGDRRPLIFHVFGAIAHLERRLIAERTKDGIAAGLSPSAAARQPGLGRSTVYRGVGRAGVQRSI